MSNNQLVLVVVLVGLIVVAIVQRLSPRRSDTKDDPYSDHGYADAAYRDDSRHWLGGFIYSNPDDPDLFVPKRFGLGWSINFGHPQARLLVVGLLLLVLALIVLGPLTGGSSASIGYHPLGRSLLP